MLGSNSENKRTNGPDTHGDKSKDNQGKQGGSRSENKNRQENRGRHNPEPTF